MSAYYKEKAQGEPRLTATIFALRAHKLREL